VPRPRYIRDVKVLNELFVDKENIRSRVQQDWHSIAFAEDVNVYVSFRTLIAVWFIDNNIGSLNATVSLLFTSLRRHRGCCIVGCLLQRPRCFDQLGLLRQTFYNK